MILRARALLVALTTLVLAGCATYSDAVREAQADVRAGRPADALEYFDQRLETGAWDELPADLDDDKVLILLERATILQAIGEFELSARDMIIVDQRLEWLDIAAYDRVELARWLYSDDARDYRAPAYERLLLNTLNMVNFLALRDYESARVEARRFVLIEEFLTDEGEDTINPDVRALGYYFSAVAFEYGGRLEVAQDYYERAWQLGMRDAHLRQRLVALYRVNSARARGFDDDGTGVVDLRIEAELRGALRLAEYRREFLEGDTLVVIQAGIAPYKRPERVPIGRAWIWAGAARSTWALTPAERAQGDRLIAQGIMKWVNLPILTDEGVNVDPAVGIEVDGEPRELGFGTDVAQQVVDAWQDVFGPVVASAVTRAITRAVAGGTARAVSGELAKNAEKGGTAIGVIGFLASLALEGGMAAADTPDTRSWTMLPAGIWVHRSKLEPGTHQIGARVGGRLERRPAQISETGLNLFNYSRLR